MASVVQAGMYGSINTDYTKTNGFYVIQFLSDAYTKNKQLMEKLFLLVNQLSRHNIFYPFKKTQPLQHTTIVTTRTIIHARLDVIAIRDVQDIPKNVCNRIQLKKSIQRHHISMTDSHYDYILYEIERQEKNDFERNVSVNSNKEQY